MSTDLVRAELTTPGEESVRPDDPAVLYKGQMKKSSLSNATVPNVVLVNLTNLPAESPERLVLVGMGDPRLKVKKAVPVEISVEPDCIVAHFGQIEEFGCGKTTSEALDDLSKALGELFFELESRNNLGPDLGRVRQILRQYFEPVRLHTDENS